MRTLLIPALIAVLAGAGTSAGQAPAHAPGQPSGQGGPAAQAYSVEPFTPTGPVAIRGTGVRLRAAPFATATTPVLSSGSTGLLLNIVGIARQKDADWYQVVLRSGQLAFIRSDLTSAPSPSPAGSISPFPPATIAENPLAELPAQTVAPAQPPLPGQALSQPAPAGGASRLDLPSPLDPPGLRSQPTAILP